MERSNHAPAPAAAPATPDILDTAQHRADTDEMKAAPNEPLPNGRLRLSFVTDSRSATDGEESSHAKRRGGQLFETNLLSPAIVSMTLACTGAWVAYRKFR